MQLRRKDRQVNERSEIEAIISRCDVCRIAFADNNIPYIVTMNFGYLSEQQCFYFHSACEGRKIDLIAKNNYVCFEMDTDHALVESEKGCNYSMKYSSIVGYGRLNIVTSNIEKKTGLDIIMLHYSNRNDLIYSESDMASIKILRLDIEEMTTKKK